MLIEFNKEAKCSYEGCDKPAECIACGRNSYKRNMGHEKPALYCSDHGRVVADEDNPEYIVDCPNCGCLFGVN